MFKADHSMSCTVLLIVSPPVPVAFAVCLLVLHWGHGPVIMCNYEGVGHRMHGKSSLQINLTYRRCSYSDPIIDALGKIK